MSTSLQNWNFSGQKLAQDTKGADFVTSESTLLLVSPQPTYTQGVINQARAVALTQDLQFNQQRQVVQVHEVGSNQKYTISSSRTQDSMNISRVLFDGESLMSVLAPHFEGAAAYPQGDKPGYDKFLMNIGSSLFNKPIGLFAIFRDMEDQSVGGVFFERTFVMSHNMQISSKSPFVGEGVQLMFDQLHPVQTAIG
jgi:hypothetical protein